MQEVAEECKELNIGFSLALGEPSDIITKSYLTKHKIGLLVVDYSPLRLYPDKNITVKIAANMAPYFFGGRLGNWLTVRLV